MAVSLQIPHQAQYEGDVLSRMSHFMKENIITDFKITVKGKAIHCHRLVLAAVCPYFESVFNSRLKESLSGEVSMDTLNFNALSKVVEYMYGNDIEVPVESASDFFEICEIFLFESLKKQLSVIVKENITADNCIKFWKMAEMYSLTEIATTARIMMITQFNMVTRSDDFKNLTLEELIVYIEDANIPNSDDLLVACFDWAAHDKAGRQQSLVDIIVHVQLDKCSLTALKEIYNKHKEIMSLEVSHMFVEALSSTGSASRERKLVVLGGMDRYLGTPITKCWMKSEALSSPWEEFLDIPSGYQAMHCPIVCLPKGFVILCGGEDFRKNTLYNAEVKQWEDLPPTPVGLCNTTAVLKRNEILLLGGELNGEIQKSVYSLDLKVKQWKDYPPMLVEQFFPIATAVNADIFVLYNNHNNLKKTPAPMQKYCNNIKKWGHLKSPPDMCVTQAAKLINNDNSLYCTGGTSRMCARYDIKDDAWTLLTPQYEGYWGYFYQSPRTMNYYYSTLFMMNHKIYVAGGNKGGRSYDDIEEYDIDNDCWKVCSYKLPQRLTLFAMDMVDWL